MSGFINITDPDEAITPEQMGLTFSPPRGVMVLERIEPWPYTDETEYVVQAVYYPGGWGMWRYIRSGDTRERGLLEYRPARTLQEGHVPHELARLLEEENPDG